MLTPANEKKAEEREALHPAALLNIGLRRQLQRYTRYSLIVVLGLTSALALYELEFRRVRHMRC